MTPKSSDLVPKAAAAVKPSAARPRFNNSRIAAARLGIRCLKRKLSKTVNSSPRQHDLKPFTPGFAICHVALLYRISI